MKKIVLAGGSGFLGRTLAAHFGEQGFEVVILSRSNHVVGLARVVRWDGRHLGAWTEELEGAAVLVNLAGRSVDCRYTSRNRRAIMDSRIESTRVLGEAISDCTCPPEVWLNSSTATIYKHTFGEAHDEVSGGIGATPEARDAFSIEVARAWEDAFETADTPGTRKIVLRTSIVFGEEAGSVYQVLRRLTRIGLGGRMGDGRQWVSWIHRADFCAAIDWLIEHQDCSGVYNICSPNPVSNGEMMRVFRGVFGRLIGLPATRWMLEIGAVFLQTETELILKSRRVIPGRLVEDGFRFGYPEFGDAIEDLSGKVR